MLCITVWLVALSAFGQAASPELDSPAPVERLEPGTLVGAGPHERIWTSGDPDSDRRIVEIGSGMNYWDGEKWTPSDPSFEVTADAFVADRMQYKVRLDANLNQIAAVTVVTPDGSTLRSTPIGIGLYDAATGLSAIIAVVTNCSGVLVDEHRVVYENAFAGTVCGDVIYTIDRGSFAQDILFTGKLTPSDWGFPNATTRIQIFTELYGDVPQPDRILHPIWIEPDQSVRNRMVSPDLVDEVLGFGELVLGTGQTATLENINSEPRDTGAFIAKQLVTTVGRKFLIETVAYKSIADELQSLPDCGVKIASIKKIKDTKKEGYAALPPRPSTSTRVASNRSRTVGARKAVAIDYLAMLGGTYSSKIFQGDTTYFVTSAVFCNSTTTLEPGVVFKFPTNSSSYVKFNGAVTCKAASYRPAIFTAADDTTVGDAL